MATLMTIDYKHNTELTDFWGNDFTYAVFEKGLLNVNGKPSTGHEIYKDYIYIAQDTKDDCVKYLWDNRGQFCNHHVSEYKLQRFIENFLGYDLLKIS